MKPDLSDIRIVDEKGQWIPHIINWSLKNVTNHNLLLDLPVLSNNKGDQATTQFSTIDLHKRYLICYWLLKTLLQVAVLW